MTNDEVSAAGLGMFARLKAGLARTTTQLSGSLTGVFTKERLDAETVRVLEDALIRADVGTALAHDLAAEIAKDRYDTDITESQLRRLLADAIAKVLAPAVQPFVIDSSRKPFVVLVAGVNGTGKTTTIGKLAAKLTESGNRVWLAAGDTFRAAAIDQLKIWGDRAHAPVVARAPGSDSAGLAFDAVSEARAANADVLLIDTAGRMRCRTPCRHPRARRDHRTECDLPSRSISGGGPVDRSYHDQARRYGEGWDSGRACEPLQTSDPFHRRWRKCGRSAEFRRLGLCQSADRSR